MASSFVSNQGTQTPILVDTTGGTSSGTVIAVQKVDISPSGTAGTFWNGGVTGTINSGSISVIAGTIASATVVGGTLNNVGSVVGIGSVSGLSNLPQGSINVTAGTIATLGTMGTLGTVSGVGVITTVTNISNGTIQNSGTVTGVGVVTNLTNGSINVTAGTIATLGTMGTLGTALGVGVVTTVTNLSNGTIQNSGTVTGVGVVTSLTNGSINVTAGTIATLGTMGTLGTVSGVGVVSSITNGSIVVTSGTITQTTGTINTGTIQINQIPTVKVTSYGTLGTAGAGTIFGTIAGTAGAGTEYLVTDWSIVVTAGTPTVALGFGTNSGSVPLLGTGVLDQGVFPPGGGLAKAPDTANHSGTNGAIYYGITAGSALIKVAYQTVATTI